MYNLIGKKDHHITSWYQQSKENKQSKENWKLIRQESLQKKYNFGTNN